MSDLQLKYPFQLGSNRRVALADPEAYLDGLIEQVLFTMIGERVNRPEFGCNLMGLLHEPLDGALIGTAQVMVQTALRRWLQGKIEVDAVDVSADAQRLLVRIRYRPSQSRQPRVVEFSKDVVQ